MDRFARFFCDPKKVIKSTAFLILGIGVLVYVYFQLAGTTDSEIVSETSMLVTMNDYVEADAYIFRDETVINRSSDGSIVTVVSEGERVSKGQLIANIYANQSDTYLQDEINRIQRRIDILDDSTNNAGFAISDLDRIDKDIDGILNDIYVNSAGGNLAYAIDYGSELLVKLNKRDLIINSDSDYVSELSDLKNKKMDLERSINALSTPLFASVSGYFYGDVDGYENIFTIKSVGDITLDNFSTFAMANPDENLLNSGAVKIVNSFIWNMVCVINSEDLAYMNEGQSYTLSFPENRGSEIRMELERIISSNNSGTAIVIFRVNKLPSEFDYKRFQKAHIVKDSIVGLSIPKKALRVVDGEKGVYVLVGDVVRFRSVKPIAEKDNYYVVEYIKSGQLFEDDEIEYKHKPLSLYDNVIVSGKNLFDGKIVG